MAGDPGYDTVEEEIDDEGFMERYSNFHPMKPIPGNACLYSYLHYACLMKNFDLIKKLVKLGGCLSKRCFAYLCTPLMCACTEKNYLRLTKVDLTVKIVRWILAQDEGLKSLNMTNELGNTALYMAIVCGNQDVVTVLLEHGANPHSCDYHEHKGSHIARKSGRKRISRILERYEDWWSIGEWRPWNHYKYGEQCRDVMRTLVILAKSEK